MPIRPRDLLAVLIALGAAVASLVVWDYGKVDIGMTLRMVDERLYVWDVTPGGNAAQGGIWPGTPVLDLVTTDGRDVKRGEPIGARLDGAVLPIDITPWQYVIGPVSVELKTYDADYRPPAEAIPSARISTLVAGDVSEGEWGVFGTVDRGYLEHELHFSIWLVGIWLVVSVLVWRMLVHGLAGAIGRRHALAVAAAVAAPAFIWPVIQVGTAAGLAAGFLVPAAAALPLAWSLAAQHPDRQWAQTGQAGAIVAAALAGILVLRHLTSPGIGVDDRVTILFVVAAITVIPATVAASVTGRPLRQRLELASLGLAPVAALTAQSSSGPMLPLVLLAALLGVHLLPVERVTALAGRGAERVRSRSTLPAMPVSASNEASFRDAAMFVLIGLAIVLGLLSAEGAGVWAVVVGIGLTVAVFFAIRRDFLGASWTDTAVPVAAASGIPVMLAGTYYMDYMLPMRVIPTALAALGVAHVLALRHTDPIWRRRLLMVSLALTLLIAVVSFASNLAIPLVGFVALIPGVPIAFAEATGEPRAISTRLETMAVALTPGAAATMLVPSIGLFLLGSWMVAVVVWRRFTLAPLIRLAQRTQLQRDLAVAAAETERARLAADLHDDALQQLTMLVRTLDAGGQKEAADEAREIATKLRSVVGDLRLPILDDLGAGAALEWLVERVEPLAGGPVKLERSDEARPPANVELAVFRVAQEALTNAIKHGKPPIAVRYDVRTDGRVTLAIDDAGEGIGSEAAQEAPKEGHFGLVNMQQRAEQIGALLDVRRWPAGGTRVALEWRPQ